MKRELQDRITKLLKQISYKPGWEIHFQHRPQISGLGESLEIIIDYVAFDFVTTSRELEQVRLTRYILEKAVGLNPPEVGKFRFAVPVYEWNLEDKDDIYLVRLIDDAIQKVERYEFKRWFRYSGSRIYDSEREMSI